MIDFKKILVAGASVIGLSLGIPESAQAQELSYGLCIATIDPPFDTLFIDFRVSNTVNRETLEQRFTTAIRNRYTNPFMRIRHIECLALSTPLPANRITERTGYNRAFLPPDWLPAAIAETFESNLKTHTVYYQGAAHQRGYRNGSVQIQYKFLICADELQIAYGLVPRSVQGDDRYLIDGVEYAIDAPPQPLVAVDFRADFRNATMPPFGAIGTSINDSAAGVALGFGCFSGQTHTIGLLRNLIRGPITPETKRQLVNAVEIARNGIVRTNESISSEPLLSAAFESRIRAMSPAERAALRRGGNPLPDPPAAPRRSVPAATPGTSTWATPAAVQGRADRAAEERARIRAAQASPQ